MREIYNNVEIAKDQLKDNIKTLLNGWKELNSEMTNQI